MSVLLEGKTFIMFFKLDQKGETDGLSDEATFKWLLWHHTEITEALREWAKVKYPDAPENCKNSFASLIACLATGAYGGYPTENSPLEEDTEWKIQEAIRLLEFSKSSFKTKQIAKARKLLEEI